MSPRRIGVSVSAPLGVPADTAPRIPACAPAGVRVGIRVNVRASGLLALLALGAFEAIPTAARAQAATPAPASMNSATPPRASQPVGANGGTPAADPLANPDAQAGAGDAGAQGSSGAPGQAPAAVPPGTLPVGGAAPAPVEDPLAAGAKPAGTPEARAESQHIYTPNQVPGAPVSDLTPVGALVARVPTATLLNSNAGLLEFADRHRGPFSLAVETSGTYTSNLFNNFASGSNNRKGAFFEVSIPVGYQHLTAESALNVYYRATLAEYPGNSGLNHSSQIVAGEYARNSSERTSLDLSLAGGRIEAVEGYLPTEVQVGSSAVEQTNFASTLRPMYSAAATLTVRHRLSEADLAIGSLTGAFLQQSYNGATAAAPPVYNRDQTGGLDLQWQHGLDPRRALGLEVTGFYVRGLAPVGRSSFFSVQGTYQQALMSHWSLHVTGGPLYEQAKGQALGTAASQTGPTESQSSFSYTASGTLDYQTGYAHIAGGYRRVLQVGYLAAATPASEYFLIFDRPFTRLLSFALDGRYSTHGGTGNGTQLAGYSNFGLSARLSQQLTPNLTFFLAGQSFRQGGSGTSLGTNEATAGLTYTFGNLLARQGVR